MLPHCTEEFDEIQVWPAEAQRWQQQNHKDEEGVALVHSGPVLPRTVGGGGGNIYKKIYNI